MLVSYCIGILDFCVGMSISWADGEMATPCTSPLLFRVSRSVSSHVVLLLLGLSFGLEKNLTEAQVFGRSWKNEGPSSWESKGTPPPNATLPRRNKALFKDY